MRSSHWRRRGGPLVVAALFLRGCSAADHQENAAAAGNEAAVSNFASRMSGQPQPPPAAKAFELAEKTDQLEFVYVYPAAAAQIPPLVDKFQKAMTIAKADALKMAVQDQKAAKESGFPFRPHSLETRWTVTAETPRFLALQSESYIYTGGAHGMTGYDALLWDRERHRETAIEALMTSPAEFATAIRDRFCDALDKARAKKRGAPVNRSGDDDFTACIDPMQHVLVPTSSTGKLIDGITVVVGPYSAGPYAEGTYDIALPVDAAMRKAIKTEYQDAFANAP